MENTGRFPLFMLSRTGSSPETFHFSCCTAQDHLNMTLSFQHVYDVHRFQADEYTRTFLPCSQHRQLCSRFPSVDFAQIAPFLPTAGPLLSHLEFRLQFCMHTYATGNRYNCRASGATKNVDSIGVAVRVACSTSTTTPVTVNY